MSTRRKLTLNYLSFAYLMLIRQTLPIIERCINKEESSYTRKFKFELSNITKIQQLEMEVVACNNSEYQVFEVEKDFHDALKNYSLSLKFFKKEKKQLKTHEKLQFIEDKNEVWKKIVRVEKRLGSYLKKHDYV